MLTVDYRRLGLRQGELVLDLGSGPGRHAFETMRRGARVVLCDYDTGELAQARRLAAAVGDAQRAALAREVPRAGHAGAAEAEHQHVSGGKFGRWRGRRHRQRSFSVDRPTSTSTTVMIQKRTITLGSAQPLSS